jgi:hypothetical protein
LNAFRPMDIPVELYRLFLKKVREIYETEAKSREINLIDSRLNYWVARDSNDVPLMHRIDFGTTEIRHFYDRERKLRKGLLKDVFEPDTVIVHTLNIIGINLPPHIEFDNLKLLHASELSDLAKSMFLNFIELYHSDYLSKLDHSNKFEVNRSIDIPNGLSAIEMQLQSLNNISNVVRSSTVMDDQKDAILLSLRKEKIRVELIPEQENLADFIEYEIKEMASKIQLQNKSWELGFLLHFKIKTEEYLELIGVESKLAGALIDISEFRVFGTEFEIDNLLHVKSSSYVFFKVSVDNIFEIECDKVESFYKLLQVECCIREGADGFNDFSLASLSQPEISVAKNPSNQ